MPPTVYTLTHEERPNFGMNKERTVHHMVRAKITREWREAFYFLAQEAMVPRLESVEVTVQPFVKDRRYAQDVCFGCAPLAKAALDSLVDAGVIIDDNDRIVTKITFLPCIIGRDALEISFFEPESP